jgi:hypothetical protein
MLCRDRKPPRTFFRLVLAIDKLSSLIHLESVVAIRAPTGKTLTRSVYRAAIILHYTATRIDRNHVLLLHMWNAQYVHHLSTMNILTC